MCTKSRGVSLALTRLSLQLVQPFLDFRWARMLCDILSLRYSLRSRGQAEAGVVVDGDVAWKVRGSPLFHVEDHAGLITCDPTSGQRLVSSRLSLSLLRPTSTPASPPSPTPEPRRAALQTPAAFLLSRENTVNASPQSPWQESLGNAVSRVKAGPSIGAPWVLPPRGRQHLPIQNRPL